MSTSKVEDTPKDASSSQQSPKWGRGRSLLSHALLGMVAETCVFNSVDMWRNRLVSWTRELTLPLFICAPNSFIAVLNVV